MVIAAKLREIELIPENETSEIIQNVRTLVSTPRGSVPLDRGFGIDTAILDLPQPQAAALITAEVARAVAQYEPRAVVQSVTITGENTGELQIDLKLRR